MRLEEEEGQDVTGSVRLWLVAAGYQGVSEPRRKERDESTAM